MNKPHICFCDHNRRRKIICTCNISDDRRETMHSSDIQQTYTHRHTHTDTHRHTHRVLASDESRSWFNTLLLFCPQAHFQSDPAADKPWYHRHSNTHTHTHTIHTLLYIHNSQYYDCLDLVLDLQMHRKSLWEDSEAAATSGSQMIVEEEEKAGGGR